MDMSQLARKREKAVEYDTQGSKYHLDLYSPQFASSGFKTCNIFSRAGRTTKNKIKAREGKCSFNLISHALTTILSMTAHCTPPGSSFLLHMLCSGPLDPMVKKVWKLQVLCILTQSSSYLGLSVSVFVCVWGGTPTSLLPHPCTFYPLSCKIHSIFSDTLSQLQIGGEIQQINSFASVAPHHNGSKWQKYCLALEMIF